MNKSSSFFISDEYDVPYGSSTQPYIRRLFKMPETPSVLPKLHSKFIKKWSEYVDETIIQKSVDPTNGEVSFSLPIVKINLSSLLKIDIGLKYMANKDGIHSEVPLTRHFISADYHRSIFKNDATFLLNSMDQKMTLQKVGSNKFKMIEDVKGEVDLTYYPDQEYFMVESDIEKIFYGSYGNTGTTLYELSYKNWRETGDGVENLKKIPVAWFIAERQSKVDGQSIYYHYERIEDQHRFNPSVSYTSEVMLKRITNGADVNVEFDYGLKEMSENEELKLKDDERNLRMGNFLVEKHFLKSIKVQTEDYEQTFGINYDLFDDKIRNLKSITQILDNGINEILKFKNEKIFNLYLPSEIEIYHGPTTKLTYDNQIIPLPQLEKKFLLKNRPVITYGTNNLIFSTTIDNRIIIKNFDILTFKLTKEFFIFDQKTITENSLQTHLGHNFLVVTYQTENLSHIKIFHQNDQKKWEDIPTALTFNKKSKITISNDFIIIHDGSAVTVLQKTWNNNQWSRYNFQTFDNQMKIFIRGKSIFIRESSNLQVIFKNENQIWQMKLLKSNIFSTFDLIANSFNVKDEIKDFIRKSLEQNDIKVLKNVVILCSLHIDSYGQLKTIFNFITIGDEYEIIKEQQMIEYHENIFGLSKTFEMDGTTVKVQYNKIGTNYDLKVVDIYGKIDQEIQKNVGNNRNKQNRVKNKVKDDYNSNSDFQNSMKSQFLLDWKKYYPLMESGSNDLFFSENTQLRMTGDKWIKLQNERKRQIKLGEYFTLIFDNDNPENVKLVSQKDSSVIVNMHLYQPNKLLNYYPYYIAYQFNEVTTHLVVFDDGKSIVKHETFLKEELMMESNQGYFMTIKKSEDQSHSEPYELIIRNIVQFMPEKPQPAVETVEVSSTISQGKFNNRVTKYNRQFKVNKKLWTSTVQIMNGLLEVDNGYIENFVTRTDEAEIQQTTSYYDGDKNLLKTEMKQDETDDDKDFSDNLLYDVTGMLQISNFVPYKKSEDSFEYIGFEDYEDIDGWEYKSQKVIKNSFALTGVNFLQLGDNDTLQKSFMPTNKDEIFIAAFWVRSNSIKLGEYLENFKALISFLVDQSNFTELFGILGYVKHRNGEWFNIEVTIDFPKTIRMAYDEYRTEHQQYQEFKLTKFKVTLSVTGIENSQTDIDNIVFYPAPHNLEVNVYNKNHDVTARIQNDGQIARIFYNGFNDKEIGKTKPNGSFDEFLIQSVGEKNHPKTITKLKVSSGFYENFDKILFTNRWKVSTVRNWMILPSEIIYTSETSDGWIEVKDKSVMDDHSAAIRLEISLDSTKKSKFEVKFKNDSIKLESRPGNNNTELKVNNVQILEVPKRFEFVIYKYGKRTAIWINGIIVFDQVLNDTWKYFKLQFNGKVSIRNIFILNRPKIEAFYYNAFNEQEQEIKLESENSAIVTQNIYDQYGHEIVKTKPTRITQQFTAPLLKFHKDFLTSFDPDSGKIEGKVTTENPSDHGFPYYHTIYFKNPMTEKHKIGYPGQEFSLQSNFVTTYDKKVESSFINAYFPNDNGFKKHVENLANGSNRIIVYDKTGNKIAKYVQVPNFDDALMTYEYDHEGRVIKVLPPEYHEAVQTVQKVGQVWISGDNHLSNEEKEFQSKLGTHFNYDKNGNMIEKRTPDVGRQIFLYSSTNRLKFAITFNAEPSDGQTIYYNYDTTGGLIETGHITRPVSIEYLKKIVESNFHMQAIEFQKIQLSDKNSKIIETINHESKVFEDLQFDDNKEDKIISQKLTVTALTASLQTSFNLQRQYTGDHVDVLTYPATDQGHILKIKHTYNGIGQLIGIGTIEKPFEFAKFSYDANGQPSSETHSINNLNRKYSYTSPGYLNKIDDEFLSEDISYIDGGYGQMGYGDGIVMKTAFNAKWSDGYFDEVKDDKQDFNYDEGVFEEEGETRRKREISDVFVDENSTLETSNRLKKSSSSVNASKQSRNLKIAEVLSSFNDDSCISALKESNFLSENSIRFKKLLNTNKEVNLPLNCYDGNIYSEISARNQIPNYYGHRFTYGTHRELVKAKYFSSKEEEDAEPLQMTSFHKNIPGIELYTSHRIFNILREGNFISVDQRRDEKTSSIGSKGIVSLIRDDDLNRILQDLGKNDDYDYIELFVPIKQLILHTIENKKVLKLQDFENIYLVWKSAGSGTFKAQMDKFKLQANKLHSELIKQKLLPTSIATAIDPINKKLVKVLSSFTKSQIIDIVTVLSKSFSNQLLTTAFDTASYEIDPNGNHKKFATGFDSVKLDYHKHTSKLKSLNIKGEDFTVEHDGYGNMTSAPHKGVKKIIYHPVSRKVMEVLKTNGESIKFHYNAQGERILKQVYDPKYEITKEILYIRDEKGNVLMDRVMNFNQQDKTCYEVVTHYIYGPRGMIGFIRDDKFHSIFTDHSGSVRLIIRDGKVVASYDFLPYGEMMRKFVADDTADIRYLYNGKELDEEIDMYNFHARFYDPTIGRFLQTDPQSQYFSPYKFSGNSPVSFIDPDGEFAFIIAAIVCGVAGAYLSSAAHNNSWNPVKWNWKDPGTYISGVLGGLTGAFLPGAVGVAVGAVGVGITVAGMTTTAYLFAAAINKSWNPIKWNFKDPGTYNALFSGAAVAATAFQGGSELVKFAATLSVTGKVILFTFTGALVYAGAAGANNGNLKFWEWKFDSPDTYKSMIEAFNLANLLTLKSSTMKELIKNPSKYNGMQKSLGIKAFKALQKVIKNPNHPLFKVLVGVGGGYLIASKYKNDFNPLNWSNDAGTYTAVLKGVLSVDNFNVKLSILLSLTIIVKPSTDVLRTVSSVLNTRAEFSRFKRDLLDVKSQGVEQLIRQNFKGNKEEFRHRVETLNKMVKNEENFIKNQMSKMNEVRLDRSTSVLLPCKGHDSNNGFCRATNPTWNGLKQKFKKREFDDIFDTLALAVKTQRIASGRFGYASLIGLTDDFAEVNSNNSGAIFVSNEPMPLSDHGIYLKANSKIELDLQNNENSALIIVDQSQESSIYTQENSGKLEIYHQSNEPEIKIGTSVKNDGSPLFYDTVDKEEIYELSEIKFSKIFDNNNNEILKHRGIYKIPDNGIIKILKNGEFKILRSINGVSLSEIIRKNQVNKRKNMENLEKNMPNYTENCDTCNAIHWEDNLPSGVPGKSYNYDVNKELKATVVIYKDIQNNWKLSSQLITINDKVPGKVEISEIRQRTKVFDIRNNLESGNQSLRKRRSATGFTTEGQTISKNKLQFIDNGSPIVDRPTPSVLALGDFWLNATNFNSNLTLAYAFLKKLTNETLFSTNEGNMPQISEVEFEIFANDLTIGFTENLLEFSDKCGILMVIRDILEEINLQKISSEVKKKCKKNLTEEIPKYLMKEILEKNERNIVKKSSKKQFEKLKKLVIKHQKEFLERLTRRNENLYMRTS